MDGCHHILHGGIVWCRARVPAVAALPPRVHVADALAHELAEAGSAGHREATTVVVADSRGTIPVQSDERAASVVALADVFDVFHLHCTIAREGGDTHECGEQHTQFCRVPWYDGGGGWTGTSMDSDGYHIMCCDSGVSINCGTTGGGGGAGRGYCGADRGGRGDVGSRDAGGFYKYVNQTLCQLRTIPSGTL